MEMTGDRKWALHFFPNRNSLHSWGCVKDDSTSTPNGSWALDNVMPDGVWTHIAVAHDRQKQYIYVNGILKSTVSWDSTGTFTFETTTGIIYPNTGAKFNDFRVYDECLSVKQIKEIAKGLVVHYPLNSGYGNENLVPNVSQYTKISPLVKTSALTDEWAWMPGTTFICEPSTTYTIQVRSDGYLCGQHGGLYQPSDKAFTFWLYICNEDTTKDPYNGGWDTPMCLTSANPSYIGHGNLHTWQYTTPSNAKYISLRTNTYSNGTDETTVKFWDIKVEKGTKATLPVPNKADALYNTLGYNDTTIYNNANFENSLEKVGDLVYSSDTPLYDSSTDFNQTGYLKNSSFNLSADKMTVCFWVKIPETITAQHFLFSTHNNWPYNGVSMYRDPNSNFYHMLIKSGAENSYSQVSVNLEVDTWTFLTIIYTGEEYKVYKNGVLYNITTYGSGGKVHNPVLYLGNSLYSGTPSSETDEASMSDFRIYASVLSEADIKRLYQSRAKIDKSGTLYCSQFIEDTNTTNLLEDYSFPTISTDNTGKVAFSTSLIDCSDSATGKATKIVCTSDCLGFWYNANSWVTARSKFIVGKQYIWSMYIKSDNRTNITFSVECSSNETKNNFVIDNNYRRIEGIFTYSDSTQWSSFTCYPTFNTGENIYIHTFCVEEYNPKISIDNKSITYINSLTEIESEEKCKIYKQNIQSTEIVED